MSAASIVNSLRSASTTLTGEIDQLSKSWLEPVLGRLKRGEEGEPLPRAKQINDPIWGVIDLLPSEVLLLDSPLMQRLRGVRQLGLAHLVFPTASHDRFSHSCGVVAAAVAMLDALTTNTSRRDSESLPTITKERAQIVRLAALLHDAGHGAFSHALEALVSRNYEPDLKAFRVEARKQFSLDSEPAPAEIIAVLVVLSTTMRSVLSAAIFGSGSVVERQLGIVECILGARGGSLPPFLTAIVSSSVDADKMDYLARDARHAGLPIEFDTRRLISKLEVLRCNANTLPADQVGNLDLAAASQNGEYFDMGISASGVGSLEQLLVNRAFLYDRVYFHHKVRAADAMAQRVLRYAAKDRQPFTLKELYLPISDDTMIMAMGGMLTYPGLTVQSPQAKELARSVVERDIYVRAFAFRAQFMLNIADGKDEERRSERAEMWAPINAQLALPEKLDDLEAEIVRTAKECSAHLGKFELAKQGEWLQEHHVIADLAPNRTGNVRINTRSHDGCIDSPDLMFNPARWSGVYDLQKRTGYVFCPRSVAPLIALASKIVFFRWFGVVMGPKAERAAKASGAVPPEWFEKLVAADIIDQTTAEVLKGHVVVRCHVQPTELNVPPSWENESPGFALMISDRLRNALPHGMSAEDKAALTKTLSALFWFVDVTAQEGGVDSPPAKPEAKLQEVAARFLRAQKLNTQEAGKLGGGEYDLLVEQRVLIENKVAAGDPFTTKADAPYQARRYAIPLAARVVVVLVAGQYSNDALPPRMSDSFRIQALEDARDRTVEIRVVVPAKLPPPSAAKKPKAP